MVPFTSPQHGFPLIAGGILQPISSLAYVDDAKHYIVVPKQTHTHTCEEFFNIVQGYCHLLANLSLVIKMGQNVKKCTLYSYNIPLNVAIPDFTSMAWSFDPQGPAKGIISIITMQEGKKTLFAIMFQTLSEKTCPNI